MAKRLRYYDNDKKYIPMTHTNYVRYGSRRQSVSRTNKVHRR